ncbi:MAG: hypothetical protein OQL18_02120 [Deltaproteobacteria bacterium]|nr:hypothetical protein [Deltaproteobacteria bacterium]
MFQFDLSLEPLTYQELQAELEVLKGLRKNQIKYSCISDVLHAFVFIGLYFSHFLGGYSVLVAVAISTVFAIILATVTRKTLQLGDRIAIAAIALGTTIATGIILNIMLNEEIIGSLVAGLTAGSIVIVGATLGRRIKQVMVAIEEFKPIAEDDHARQELMALCRKHPKLDDYRELAVQNLRPHLTYGELSAMRAWSSHQALSNGS